MRYALRRTAFFVLERIKMLNFQALMMFNQAKAKFMENHPQVQTFLDNVSGREPEVGQEVAIAVRYPDGAEYKAGVRITESDLELLNTLRELTRRQ